MQNTKAILFIAITLIAILCPQQGIAQDSNEAIYTQLALACMPALSAEQESVSLSPFNKMPYVRSALVDSLKSLDTKVYLPDSTRSLAQLSYTINKATVSYKRLRRKKVQRDVTFNAAVMLVSHDGEVLEDAVCDKQFSDTVKLADLSSLESGSYPETQASHPKAGLAKRFLQPAMLTAASALTVYMFFTLRSESGSDGS